MCIYIDIYTTPYNFKVDFFVEKRQPTTILGGTPHPSTPPTIHPQPRGGQGWSLRNDQRLKPGTTAPSRRGGGMGWGGVVVGWVDGWWVGCCFGWPPCRWIDLATMLGGVAKVVGRRGGRCFEVFIHFFRVTVCGWHWFLLVEHGGALLVVKPVQGTSQWFLPYFSTSFRIAKVSQKCDPLGPLTQKMHWTFPKNPELWDIPIFDILACVYLSPSPNFTHGVMDVNDPTKPFGLRIQRTQRAVEQFVGISTCPRHRARFVGCGSIIVRHDVDADSVGNPQRRADQTWCKCCWFFFEGFDLPFNTVVHCLGW